jgi:MFS transporter, CP family, cyanate transporter
MGLGQSRDIGGYLLAGLTLIEVVAGLGVSAFIGRFPDRRGALIAVLLPTFLKLGF